MHTLFSSSPTLCALPRSLPLVRRLSLRLPFPPRLLDSFLLLADRAACYLPLPPASRKIDVTHQSPNCVTFASVTVIIRCGVIAQSSSFFFSFKRKLLLKISRENWPRIIVSICCPQYSNNDKRIIVDHWKERGRGCRKVGRNETQNQRGNTADVEKSDERQLLH